MNRRAFVTAVAGGWAVEALLPDRRAPTGRIVGASHHVGHLVRDGAGSLRRGADQSADVVVVGGGIAGLSAAWRLGGAGLDVRVLELEPFVGGTSTWSDDGVCPHPWGAHYLAAPNPEARATLRLLADLGVVTGWDAQGSPRFDARALCHAPQERLFWRGAWESGLVPYDDLTAAERDELVRFSTIEERLTEHVGTDGRSAFTIPVSLSSRDPDLLALDRMSMAEWLGRQGFTTPFLRWYVGYALLDDFGGTPDDVSAWAGLHYFAARKARSEELEGSHFLVWPEGNGFLVKGMLARIDARIDKGRVAVAVHEQDGAVAVDVVDPAAGELVRIRARAAVLAVPAFVAARLFPEAAGRGLPVRVSSPWLVANLHVRWPVEPDRPWDSVLYEGAGLGYVDARHQRTDLAERTVLTYYRAYGAPDVAATRAALVAAPWERLLDGIVRDLAPAHPSLLDELERADVMIWGHGMPRPRPGFLGERPFEVPCALGDRIAWAHVDRSGMAIFEEAHARGVEAAEHVAERLGVHLGETWL